MKISTSLSAIPDWLATRTQRERRLLLGAAIALLLALIFGVILPLDRSVSQAHARIDKKQGDLTWMRQVAPELVGTRPPPAASQESLLVIVERSARESGLSQAIAGSEPSGPGALNVRLEKASFDTLIAWLARLSQQNGIRVDNATIDSAGPGLVNAAVLLRTG
jgi:general secretion pathway protein M